MVVVFLLTTFLLYRILRSFEELIIKYIELNGGYFKNQKNLIQKSNDTAMALKKLSGLPTTMKGLIQKMERTTSKLDSSVDTLDKKSEKATQKLDRTVNTVQGAATRLKATTKGKK